jgi:hypothetical protein
MAQIEITIPIIVPDNKVVEMRDLVAAKWGWTALVDDGNGGTIANPLSKIQYITQYLTNYLAQVAKSTLKQTYQEEKKATVDASINIT